MNTIFRDQAEEDRAKRLYDEGFVYIYKVGKKVYASNPNVGRLRLIQGGAFDGITRPLNLKQLFDQQEVNKE